jgi:hypothetical protein
VGEHGDLVEDCADDLFAVGGGGAGRVPDPGQVGCCGGDGLLLGGGQGGGCGVLEPVVFFDQFPLVVQGLFPVSFQLAGDEPVLGARRSGSSGGPCRR